jgi:hypothetical protein
LWGKWGNGGGIEVGGREGTGWAIWGEVEVRKAERLIATDENQMETDEVKKLTTKGTKDDEGHEGRLICVHGP